MGADIRDESVTHNVSPRLPQANGARHCALILSSDGSEVFLDDLCCCAPLVISENFTSILGQYNRNSPLCPPPCVSYGIKYTVFDIQILKICTQYSIRLQLRKGYTHLSSASARYPTCFRLFVFFFVVLLIYIPDL